ncbi:glycosyltransferase family 25 protein [Mesorhizobium sp. KR1-2]|uniref:glycosyltransferase family 25 protein n=1 Tax=Mesorhizobium sp. KR1-2 TaxID=3156609 RepID=UPI0032B59DCE
MIVKALVIHLARAEQRKEHVKKLAAELPFPLEIIEAVDGKLLPDEAIEKFCRPRLYRPTYPFALNRNEIACFLSHRRAWQAIVDQNLDAALIMEDDAAPIAPFSDGLELALTNIEREGFIRFPFRDGRESGRLVARSGDVSLIEPVCAGLGMVTQLVSRDAAARLLKATETVDRPVDVLLQMPWVTGVVARSVVPGGIREISPTLGGSTLKPKRQISKLKRELLRPIYRARIAMRARLAAMRRQ